MATLAGGTVDREWQRLQLSQQDVLDLKRALVEDEDPTGLMADLGVKHFHKPFFRIRIPVGGSDVSHTRDAATCEDAFPSIAEFAQKRSCPARAEVLALSRSQHQPLLGNLRCISLGDMRLLERFLDPENCGTPRNLKHDGGGSGAGGGSGGGGRGPAESAASLLEELGLSVYDRPYCEIGPELGLDNTDFDLDSTYVLQRIANFGSFMCKRFGQVISTYLSTCWVLCAALAACQVIFAVSLTSHANTTHPP